MNFSTYTGLQTLGAETVCKVEIDQSAVHLNVDEMLALSDLRETPEDSVAPSCSSNVFRGLLSPFVFLRSRLSFKLRLLTTYPRVVFLYCYWFTVLGTQLLLTPYGISIFVNPSILESHRLVPATR